MRKLYAHGNIVEERIYLDDYEIYRLHTTGNPVNLERHIPRISDDRRRVAIVETKTIDASIAAFAPTTRQRFQLENQLGSSTMELDEAGAVLSSKRWARKNWRSPRKETIENHAADT